MSIILFILFGLSVGVGARILAPGNAPGGWYVWMTLGIFGAGLGAFLGRVVGLYREGEPGGYFAAIFGAILVIVAYHEATRRRRWHQEREIQ